MVRGAVLGAIAAVAAACAVHDAARSPRGSVTARTNVDSLLMLGDSVYRRSAESAQKIWTVALSAARTARDSAREARALTGLGQSARQLGDPAAARRLGEQALALKLRLGMKAELFRSYNALGLLAWRQERLDDATSLFTKAMDAATATGDSSAMAKATMNLGLVAKEFASFERARSLFEKARLGATAARDSTTLARALDNLGALDITLGDPAAAIASLDTARRIARGVGDSLTELNARGQLAMAYDAIGQPQRAFGLFDSAMVMARQSGNRDELAEDLELMAGLFLDAGDFSHALDYYQRSLAVTDSLGQPEERGNILRNEARVYASLGSVAVGFERGTEARRIHRAGRMPYPELADVIVLASLSQQRGREADALALLDTARTMATALRAPIARASVGLAEAQVAAESRDWNRVLQAIARERGSLELLGSGQEATALSLESRAQAQVGHLDAALAAGRKAIVAIERVRGNYASGELRTTYVSAQADVYGAQVLLLLRLNKLDEAFEVADAARGRGLLDHLAAARAEIGRRNGADAAAIQAGEGDALLRRIDTLVAKLQKREARPPQERTEKWVALSAQLRDSVAAARAEYEALAARTSSSSGLGQFAGSGRRPSIRDVTQSLRPHEVLLEYVVLDDRILVFALTPAGVTVDSTRERAASIALRIKLARDLIEPRNDTVSAKRVLSVLHGILIKPIESRGVLRDATDLIIVPHGPLVYLPFSALVDAGSGRYLGQRYAVLKLATAASLPWLRNASARTRLDSHARLFAPFPDRLPATRREVAEIAKLLPSSKAYIGSDASKSNLRQALESGAVVHVATHANMNQRNPLFSQLEMAGPDWRLEVHELLAYRVAAPLVFLSGCETALGTAWSTRFDTGEDYTTIAQTLLYAGAQNVVATLWRIDDSGAATFAAHFYRYLGSDVADALAKAQRAMLADPRYRSPYYWAAYEAMGSGRLSPMLAN